MPWSTPTLKTVRGIVRDNIRGSLPGADASVPNSVLRVLSDAQGGLCHLNLQYIDWLALQLLPDTAETEWLDRHGVIWLVNSDGSLGRKQATFATGIVLFTGTSGTIMPMGIELQAGAVYETTAETMIGSGPTPAPVRALDPGSAGNLETGVAMSVASPMTGIESVESGHITGGFETENDDDLRARILQRIRNPAMGGSAENYVTWALAVPGVTQAWAGAEQGPGTITVRFLTGDLCDEDDDHGWPSPEEILAVDDYIDRMRPVTVKDSYVVAPIKQFIDVTITNLVPDDPDGLSGAIETSLCAMLREVSAPGQTIYAAWVSYAIMNATGVQSFTLVTTDDYVMPSLGHMAVLGNIVFEDSP